jgi:energy-converting hydrogenase A subunit M
VTGSQEPSASALRDLQSKIESLTRSRLGAQAQRDQALAARAQVVESIQGEFGVSSMDEVQALILSLETELARLIGEARSALAQAQGSGQ